MVVRREGKWDRGEGEVCYRKSSVLCFWQEKTTGGSMGFNCLRMRILYACTRVLANPARLRHPVVFVITKRNDCSRKPLWFLAL